MDKLTFQQEEDNLLYTILDKRFFSVWRNPNENKLWQISSLELFLTSACNLDCEYCYLRVRGDKLYPKEYRKESTIKTNLLKILDWIIGNGFSICELSLFSGEIWHLPFGVSVLETILSYIQKGMKIEYVMIPTNTTFALEENTLNTIQDLIDRFNKAGSRLVISHSIEGNILEDISRPMKTTKKVRDEKFYDRVFAFAKKNGFYFHPMVAAANIEKWPENYDWFREMCKKYNLPFPRSVMMLEVRNPDWTPEKLEHLKAYYKHQIDHLWTASNGNYDDFLANVFGIGSNDDDLGYCNIAFPLAKTQSPCTISTDLMIRVGDMAIIPCHRTSYPEFIYGKFKVDDSGMIRGIEAINTQVATKVLYTNHKNAFHGCDVCPYNGVCMRQCLGEQYEATEEIFMTDPVVCNLFKTKYNFLIDTYEQMGVLQYMAKIPSDDFRYLMSQEILREVDKINAARR